MDEKLEQLLELARGLNENQLNNLIDIASNPDLWLND